MVEQYKEIAGVEFHPVKSEWAEKEFIGALGVIDIPGHTVAWVYSRVLLLRSKEWFCAKFSSQYKAESAFRRVVREGRKWAKEKGNTESSILMGAQKRPR